MSWSDLDTQTLRYERSVVESARFGRSVARLTVGVGVDVSDETAHQLRRQLAESEDDVVIVRYPSQHLRIAAVLADSSRTLIPAGALTYWESSAASLGATSPGKPGVMASGQAPTASVGGRQGCPRAELLALVESVVRDSFRSYPNHYASNPLLPQASVLDGYVEWALTVVNENVEDVIVLRLAERPVGIATFGLGAGTSHLEILLAGMVGRVQGRGLYGVLLHEVGREALARKCGRVIISTQSHNVNAQRAWARAGFLPFASIDTVHAVRPGLLDAS